MAKQRLFLLDGNSLCYRAYHAIPALATSRGDPTNAVLGFLLMLRKLLKDERPEYLGVAFDRKGPTVRHVQFAAYKATRQPMPEELVGQLGVIKEALGLYHIPIFEQDGIEADDLLATLATRGKAAGLEVLIVTADKDALQLVDDQVKVYHSHDNGQVYDAARVEARFGVRPDQMVDLLALTGDSSDNIPGVPGIGPKTAQALLQQFGTVEGLLGRTGDIAKRGVREAVESHAGQVRSARALVTLSRDVPVPWEPEALRVTAPDEPRLQEFFRRLEFTSWLNERVPAAAPAAGATLVASARELRAVAAQIAKAPAVALVGVGDGTDPMRAALTGLALALPAGVIWSVHVAMRPGAGAGALPLEQVREVLGPVLRDARVAKVGHDLKWLAVLLERAGMPLRGVGFDTMLAAYLGDPVRGRYGLDDVVLAELGERCAGGIGREAGEPGTDPLAAAAAAAAVLWRVREPLARTLRRRGVWPLFERVELPLVEVLAAMEEAGVAVDTEALRRLGATIGTRLRALERRIHDLAGGPFNVNSPLQLREVLFTRLGLPVQKRTKTGPSTDVEVLEHLAQRHPLPAAMLEYRELAKLASTYVETLPGLVHPDTGRVHTTLNQAATATGRLSSSDPNLQNIPVRTELGREIRRAFVAGARGTVLLAADYSQIELRLLAHLSRDRALLEAFRGGADIHRRTAALVYGVPEAEVTTEMREAAKAVNFGIIYGMNAHGLSRILKIGLAEAQAFIEAYFARYPGVQRYLRHRVEAARRTGGVVTLFRRRRPLPEVRSANAAQRQFGERAAVNTPIQGSAADLMKLAMIAVHRELGARGLKTRMVLQVHDELVFEVPRGELTEVTTLVRQQMEGAVRLAVPIVVSIKTGANWLEAK